MNAPTLALPAAIGDVQVPVTSALRTAVGRLCRGAEHIVAYHHGWVDAVGAPTEANGGKMLRPALALLSARAAGAPAEAGLPAAVAVEMTHAFSLLHDDIMDGDAIRRHRPTAWKVFGAPLAILAGDTLLAASLSVLLDSGLPGAAAASRRLASDTRRLIEGQASDLAFESRTDVSVSECLLMARQKTGALLGCAAALGAELVGAPASQADGLARFGEEIGVAFQLVDDLLGIWGSPAQTGKAVLSDLRIRKKSLPVVAALQAGGSSSNALAELYLRPEPLDEEQLQRAAELIELADGRAWAEAEAARRLKTAAFVLTDLGLAPGVHADFLGVAAFVTGRDF